MSNLIPVVTPANNAEGVTVDSQATIIFERAMEEGSISSSSCFIVEIPTHNLNNLDSYIAGSSLGDILPSFVSSDRIDLLTEDPYTSPDYGDNPDSGELYRTKIRIKPNTPLKPNTTYAGLISRDVSQITVFDSKANLGNTGSGSLSTQGLYTGLVEDEYTITIGIPGGPNELMYMWTRLSDGKTSTLIHGRSRFIEVNDGVFVRFEDGEYAIGDSFSIRVQPADKQTEIYSWIFASGSGDYESPIDENSGSLLNLPIFGEETVEAGGLEVVSIDPPNGLSLMEIPRKSNLTIGSLVFFTNEYTSLFNNYSIRIVSGGVAGSEVIALLGEEIEIQIEENVSTAEQVSTAFNLSSLVNTNFISSTESPLELQILSPDIKMSEGVSASVITVTFNKEVGTQAIDSFIAIESRPIYPSGKKVKIPYSYTVSGKQLFITLKE